MNSYETLKLDRTVKKKIKVTHYQKVWFYGIVIEREAHRLRVDCQRLYVSGARGSGWSWGDLPTRARVVWGAEEKWEGYKKSQNYDCKRQEWSEKWEWNETWKREGTREKVKGLPGKCQACFLSHRPAFKCGERSKLLKPEKVRHFCPLKPPESKNAKYLCNYDHHKYVFF